MAAFRSANHATRVRAPPRPFPDVTTEDAENKHSYKLRPILILNIMWLRAFGHDLEGRLAGQCYFSSALGIGWRQFEIDQICCGVIVDARVSLEHDSVLGAIEREHFAAELFG